MSTRLIVSGLGDAATDDPCAMCLPLRPAARRDGGREPVTGQVHGYAFVVFADDAARAGRDRRR